MTKKDSEAEVQKSNNKKQANKWYSSVWLIIFMLVFFAPLGIFLAWKYAPWSQTWKIVSSMAAVIFFIWVMVTAMNAPVTLTIDSARDGRIQTEDATYKLTGTVTAADRNTVIDVNGKPAQINRSTYSAVIDLNEGDNTVVVTAKKKDKTTQDTVIIHRITAAELQARADADAANKKSAEEKAAQKKSDEEAAQN